jgi:hypothetical protein
MVPSDTKQSGQPILSLLGFLRTLLKNGPLPRLSIHRRGWEKGITDTAMDRAAQALGVVETGEGDEIIWTLRKRSTDP